MEQGRNRWGLVVLAVALMGVLAVMQRPEAPDPAAAAKEKSGAEVQPVGIDPLVGVGKALFWLKWSPAFEGHWKGISDRMIEGYVDELASGAAGRLRGALLAGELGTDADRESRLMKLEADLAPESVLRKDIATARMLAADGAERPPAEAVAEFKSRHGWYARGLLARSDEAVRREFRAETEAGGTRIVVAGGLYGLAFGVAFLTGVVLLILGIVWACTGRIRSRLVRTPEDMGWDRGLWLETVVAFLAGFLLVHVAAEAVEWLVGGPRPWMMPMRLGMQWLLVLTMFWPLVRGMSRERFRGEVGWHRGRGAVREVVAGVMGYMAGLVVLIAVVVAALLVQALVKLIMHGPGGGGDPVAPENKVLELVGGTSGWTLVLVVTLATIWAPLVEETIFRGALYRHLRARLAGVAGVAVSVLVAAGAFGLAHSYVWIGVVAVTTLGAVFAVMREWRGSLIAPITAHCLHNSVAMALMLSVLPAMRGD